MVAYIWAFLVPLLYYIGFKPKNFAKSNLVVILFIIGAILGFVLLEYYSNILVLLPIIVFSFLNIKDAWDSTRLKE
jgi:hypothetical protein